MFILKVGKREWIGKSLCGFSSDFLSQVVVYY